MSASQEIPRSAGFGPVGQTWHRRNDRWRPATLQRAMLLAEGSVVLLAGVFAGLELPPALGAIPTDWVLLASGIAALVALNASSANSGLRPEPLALASQLVLAAGAGAATLSLVGVAGTTALDWAAGNLIVAGTVLAALRIAYTGVVDRWLDQGRLAIHVAVVGTGAVARRTEARLAASEPRLVSLVGRYAPGVTPDGAQNGLRGTLRTLLCDCRLGIVDAVVLAPETDDVAGLDELRTALRPCAQDIYLAADLMGHAPGAARVYALGTTPVLLVSQRPINGWASIGKQVLDKVGALSLLVAVAPFLLLIAVAIRLETRGPILFRQLRVGYNNELFHIFKFRSMRADATDRLAKQQTTYGDQRVTRVGRVIRRLSLDELPQLLNVVRGEMSLVGPRPHAPGTSIDGQRIHTLVDDYARRHLVRPGITGLAQVRGSRGGLQHRRQIEDRLASDLEYVDRWSLWLDLKILFLTVFLELRGSHGC